MNLAGLIGGQHLSGGGNRVQLIACTSNIDAVHMARRRAVLAQFLAEAEPGIRLCEHIEDVDGAVVFRQACVMGLKGSSPSGATAVTAPGAAARRAVEKAMCALFLLSRSSAASQPAADRPG
jgi:hypothetical protein